MGRKCENEAKRTVLQGGFRPGQRVVLRCAQPESGVPEGAIGTLGPWDEEEGRWQVRIDGVGAAAVLAEHLREEAHSEDEEEQAEPELGQPPAAPGWPGRQVASKLRTGDLVEAWHKGTWQDAVIVDQSSCPSVARRVVFLAGCREATVALTCLRRKENYLVHRRRREACEAARAKLSSGNPITDEDVLEVLRLWAFEQNPMRKNVIPEGQKWVYSDTLGLVHSRSSELCAESRLAVAYPDVMRLMGQWMRHSGPREKGKPFPFTGVNLNFAYAARLHRDRLNAGPSLLRALGSFEGGQVGYFPDDNGKLPLEALPADRKVVIDTRVGFTIIDGRRAHQVEPFIGERYSVVFFTCGTYLRAPAKLRKALVSAGAEWPTPAAMSAFSRLLPEARGYCPEAASGSAGTARKRRAEATPDGEPPARRAPAAAACEATADEPAPPRNAPTSAAMRRRLRRKTRLPGRGAATAARAPVPPPAAGPGSPSWRPPWQRPAAVAGGRFELLAYPHLALGLKLGAVYTTGNLVRKCKGDRSKLTALRRKLRDPSVFKPLEG